MKNLNKFIKVPRKEIEGISTSVYLTKDQVEFFKKKNLNLSAIIRELIENIIKEYKHDKKDEIK